MSVPDIYDSFKGKNVFFTGVTGFVGKVLLYKILKEFSDIGKVYVLCRPKKGVSMIDRFKTEVLSSPCFFPLIKEIGEAEWTRRSEMVVPVGGDITHHRLGLSDKEYDTVTDNVNIIVHLAATVNFDEKLNLSCEMNVLGSVRVMALAHKCKFLESYIHTSTCYVNWNRHGDTPVKEQLYPLPFDAESMLKYILSLNPMQMPKETKRLLEQYKYPNTYTFTKSITEHILMKQRGNLPLVIVRPAIIGCSWREPYNGWVDALTAAGGLFLVSGLGLLHEFIGDDMAKADVVPVDHVVNLLLKVTHRSILYHKPTSMGKIVEQAAPQSLGIVSVDSKNTAIGSVLGGGSLLMGAQLPGQKQQLAALAATSTVAGSTASDPGALSPNFPRVYHSSTSNTMNTMHWNICTYSLCGYWNEIKHPKALGKSYVTFYKNKNKWAANFYAKRVIPVSLLLALTKIPGLTDPKKQKLIKRLQKATNKVYDLNMQFWPFTNHHWFFEIDNSLENLEDGCLSKKAQRAFTTDVFDINWYHYGISYSWGMIKFIMKDDNYEQPVVPISGSEHVFRASL